MNIGIDLGGTKIEGVVLSSDGTEIARERVPTPSSAGYEAILSEIAALISRLEERAGGSLPFLGIGTPGTLDSESQAIRGSNTVCLNGRPLKRDLESLLERPVVIENDANCFALAEAILGAGKGERSVFGVILGTGVGGGVILGGEILRGRQGIAGEWGHNQLEPEGEPCYCGRIGCVETVISGPAVERFYARISGISRGLPEIVRRREAGDEFAAQAVKRLTDEFGRALAVVVNILDPDVVVLGGGVSNVEPLYTDGLRALERSVFHPQPRVNLRKNLLGDSAGVLGAAFLVERNTP